jgi:hypothetical protein
MHVGAFVRFNSRIILDNPGLAVSSDKAVVTSMSADGRTVDVVWSDGSPGTYKVNHLKRIPSTMGGVVASEGKPLKHNGYVPPARPSVKPNTN